MGIKPLNPRPTMSGRTPQGERACTRLPQMRDGGKPLFGKRGITPEAL